MVRGKAAELPHVAAIGIDLIGVVEIVGHLEPEWLAGIGHVDAQAIPGIAVRGWDSRARSSRARSPACRMPDRRSPPWARDPWPPSLRRRSRAAPRRGAPFCQGESPGANFHGPGSVAAELPRVMVSAEAAAELGVECG